jgi:hypothetical protein
MTSLIGVCMTWGVVGVTRFTRPLEAYYFFEAVDPIWTGVALALSLTGLLTGAVGLYREMSGAASPS